MTPEQLKKGTREWMDAQTWHVAATYTFAENVTARQAAQTMETYWARVDRAIYRNAVARYGKRIKRINIREGNGDGTKFHYHSIICRPEDRFQSNSDFIQILDAEWRRVGGQNRINRFDEITDQTGWINYITKEMFGLSTDTIDENSSYFGGSQQPHLLQKHSLTG